MTLQTAADQSQKSYPKIVNNCPLQPNGGSGVLHQLNTGHGQQSSDIIMGTNHPWHSPPHV